MMDFGYYGFMPFFGLGAIFMILFWGIVIWGFIVFVKWVAGENGGARARNKEAKSAIEILRERYAKGEIDKSEFEDKKKDLKE